MDHNRRNLMKGMLTGGTLLALGLPPGALASAPAGKVKRCGLLLENLDTHAEFAAGVRAAYTEHLNVQKSEAFDSDLLMVKLSKGLLSDYAVAAELLEKSHDIRWVAMLDDGSAAVFTELVRAANARLALLGSHASSGSSARFDVANGTPELRHVWTAASTALSPGSILASQLIMGRRSFSIKENFLSTAYSSVRTAQAYAAPVSGFETWRSAEPDAAYLYCSGLSPSDGCALLGWDIDRRGGWVPVSQKDVRSETASGIGTPAERPGFSSWVESVGYSVMAATLGIGGGTSEDAGRLREPCSSRAFVHKPSHRLHAGLMDTVQKFTSFVIET